MTADGIEDRKLARWHATKDGALYVCPHCWSGTKQAGRCSTCRRFDVRAVRGEPTGVTPRRPPLSKMAKDYAASQASKAKRRRKRRPLG